MKEVECFSTLEDKLPPAVLRLVGAALLGCLVDMEQLNKITDAVLYLNRLPDGEGWDMVRRCYPPRE